MYRKLRQNVRPWLPRTRDQLFDTGNGMCNIPIRLEGALRAILALVTDPSLATWMSAICMLAALAFAVWGLSRIMQKVNEANQKVNPPDGNQSGSTFGGSEGGGQA